MDFWDMLALLGLILVTAGIACIYYPAAFIFFGASLLAAYILREVYPDVPAKDKSESPGEPDESAEV